jgi:myosin I
MIRASFRICRRVSRTSFIFFSVLSLSLSLLSTSFTLKRKLKSHHFFTPIITSSHRYIVDGIDDTQDFEEMQDAARRLGFSKAQQTFMFDTIAGILHLGSITFKAKRVGSADGCEVKRSKPLKLAAQFLHLTEEQLRKCVTNRSIVVGGRKTYIPLNPEQAVDACDALAKSIYSRMFDWIVARVNDATKAKAGLKKRNQKYIGVCITSFLFLTC